MKSITKIELLKTLRAVSEADIGIRLVFSTEDEAILYRAKLYTLRKEFPEFASYSFLQRGQDLLLIKGEPDDGPEEE